MVIKRGDNVKKTYEELEKENAELKRQLEERQIIYEPIANEIKICFFIIVLILKLITSLDSEPVLHYDPTLSVGWGRSTSSV